jgi:hypothetical protein
LLSDRNDSASHLADLDETWWSAKPDANIGCNMGASRCAAVDVDL